MQFASSEMFVIFKYSPKRREILVQRHAEISQKTSIVITFLWHENETCLWDAEIRRHLPNEKFFSRFKFKLCRLWQTFSSPPSWLLTAGIHIVMHWFLYKNILWNNWHSISHSGYRKSLVFVKRYFLQDLKLCVIQASAARQMKSALFLDFSQRTNGSFLPTFPDNLSVSSSKVK